MVELKRFSTKTKKDHIKVLIYSSRYKIQGTIHLPTGGRLTDFLNTKGLGAEGEIFIPVTDASVYDLADKSMIYYTPFLNVNKRNISFIFPHEDKKDTHK